MATNSDQVDGAARPGKRERLVAAARDLVYRQGVARTTLADIAQAADVPVGNVYYYFKTKDDIVGAVVEEHRQRLESSLAELERRHRTPAGRLEALGAQLADQRDDVADYGCPYGTLSSELAKLRTGRSDPLAATLLQAQIDWAERQFREMGRGDARDLAVELVGALQGGTILSNVLGQPELMSRQNRRLRTWIAALAKDPDAS